VFPSRYGRRELYGTVPALQERAGLREPLFRAHPAVSRELHSGRDPRYVEVHIVHESQALGLLVPVS
jgi:hypothetical protein